MPVNHDRNGEDAGGEHPTAIINDQQADKTTRCADQRKRPYTNPLSREFPLKPHEQTQSDRNGQIAYPFIKKIQ